MNWDAPTAVYASQREKVPASARPATACGMALTVGGGGDPASEKRMKVQTKAGGQR
jgi:hypothetical protein